MTEVINTISSITKYSDKFRETKNDFIKKLNKANVFDIIEIVNNTSPHITRKRKGSKKTRSIRSMSGIEKL